MKNTFILCSLLLVPSCMLAGLSVTVNGTCEGTVLNYEGTIEADATTEFKADELTVRFVVTEAEDKFKTNFEISKNGAVISSPCVMQSAGTEGTIEVDNVLNLAVVVTEEAADQIQE